MTDMVLGAAGLDLGVHSRSQEAEHVVCRLTWRCAPSMANRLADGRWTFRFGDEPLLSAPAGHPASRRSIEPALFGWGPRPHPRAPDSPPPQRAARPPSKDGVQTASCRRQRRKCLGPRLPSRPEGRRLRERAGRPLRMFLAGGFCRRRVAAFEWRLGDASETVIRYASAKAFPPPPAYGGPGGQLSPAHVPASIGVMGRERGKWAQSALI